MVPHKELLLMPETADADGPEVTDVDFEEVK